MSERNIIRSPAPWREGQIPLATKKVNFDREHSLSFKPEYRSHCKKCGVMCDSDWAYCEEHRPNIKPNQFNNDESK